MDLCFDVCKQIITRTDTEQVVNLSDNYLRLVFDFKGTDWNNLSKFVLVHHNRGTTRLELENDKVTLPDGLLLSDKLVFTVYGVDDPDDETIRITTNKQKVYLLDSSYTDEYSGIAEVIDVHTIQDMYVLINSKANTSDVTSGLATKVNITDVRDGLTFTDSNKPLSANQGKILKDLVDTKADSSEMVSALNGKSNIGHKHLESDITDLKNYSVVGHTHTKSDVTDFAHNHDDRYYTETETNALLNGKSNIGHNHDERYYTESEMDTKLNGKSDTGHIHDDRYFTETETTNLLNLKVDKVTGKELSSNDFTNAYKDVLDTFDGDWSEVIEDNLDAIIAGVIDAITNAVLNRVVFEPTPQVIQSGDTDVFKAYCIHNGLPVYNKEVSFYEVFEPVVVNSASPDVIQIDEVSVFTAKVRDEEDGSLVQGAEVKFYKITED